MYECITVRVSEYTYALCIYEHINWYYINSTLLVVEGCERGGTHAGGGCGSTGHIERDNLWLPYILDKYLLHAWCLS